MKATLKQETVLCRAIDFERVTTYVIEDFFDELTRLKQIRITPYLLFPLGYHIKDHCVHIFYKEQMSLFELLYSKEREDLRKYLDYKLKFDISFEIARIFYTLQ